MGLNPKVLYPKYLQRVRPGKRLPVKTITTEQYSSKDEINSTIANYLKKMSKLKKTQKSIILCHGHLHTKYSYLPIDYSILLDLNPVSIPDIIGDIRHRGFMSRFPPNYFDVVYLLYTPPPSPLSTQNRNIWPNIHRILKKGGQLRCNYMLSVYLKKNIDMNKTKKLIGKYFQGMYSKVKYEGSWVVLVK